MALSDKANSLSLVFTFNIFWVIFALHLQNYFITFPPFPFIFGINEDFINLLSILCKIDITFPMQNHLSIYSRLLLCISNFWSALQIGHTLFEVFLYFLLKLWTKNLFFITVSYPHFETVLGVEQREHFQEGPFYNKRIQCDWGFWLSKVGVYFGFQYIWINGTPRWFLT